MKIKELQKTVNITWSPQQQHPIFLAAGTAAQQLDSNASPNLEIYSINFSDASYDLELKANLPSQFRFQKLIWSYDTTHNGLIVGGCESGHIMIYSPERMLKNEEGLVARQDKHTGAVSGLDVNPFQTNLLASCASESEIFIWDLNNTSTHMNPGAKTQPLEDVKNVAWNRQVQHILASVFSTRCVIWDLRKSEQIIKLSDTQSHVRWHAVQWHPDVATQVWLASEDDQAPVVQLWDLRYATAPSKTMQIHQRGVLGMSWCPQDSDLMVSCGKDNRIYCWNPNTELPEGEILSEVATTATWYSDVQWCPRNPALIASSSLDGNVSIYSLFGGTQEQVKTSNKIADSFPGMDQFAQTPVSQLTTKIVYQDLKRVPKWIKRPCGVAFGFGGKLVSFNAKSGTVNISKVVTETDLVERAQVLEQALAETNIVEYCRQRADKMPDQNGRYLWYFLKANFELNPKEEMLNLLGFNKEDIEQKFSKYIKNELSSDVNRDAEQISDHISNLNHQPRDNNAIFDDITAKNALRTLNGGTSLKPNNRFLIPSGDHPDSHITEALLTGNIEAAIELCMESKRVTEALIIASTAGIELLTATQKRVLEAQQGELSEVISALVTRDWLDFINRCVLDSWKEALVATLQHSERKAGDICERLGDRLLNERSNSVEYTRNAMLCYICAGSIDKLVSAWYQLKRLENINFIGHLKTAELQELAEITIVLAKSLQQQGISLELNNCFGDFIKEYSTLLVSQGALSTAFAYISNFPTENHSNLDDLRERINNTVNSKKPTQTVYGGKPQQRGSFSQPPPLPMFAGNTTVTPLPNSLQNQYSSNAWNGPQNNLGPLLFNPQTQTPINPMPLMQSYPNDTIMPQPPRPQSTSSSQGGITAVGSGLHGRSKYVLDPSVASPASNYGGPLYNQSEPIPQISGIPTANFNTTPFSNVNPVGRNILQPQQTQPSSILQPVYNAPQLNMPPPLVQNVQRNPTPPPGWNDPPALHSTRLLKKRESVPTTAPITHPIFGVDPNQNQNGYNDPNTAYQQQSGLMPPPPSSNAMLNPLQPTQPSLDYPNPTAHNNNPQFQFQSSAVPAQQQQQYPWGAQNANVMSNTYGEPAVHQPQTRQTEPPKEKPPIPEEFIYLQTVLDELKNQCLNAATDPRTKRKFVDVAKRLENLYDCLRDRRLAPATIAALNQITQFIQIGDYANALQTHTQIAFGSDFSQCAGFMPGLKVLIQSATDLQIYLR